MPKLTTFTLNNQVLPVRYVETQRVKKGVECDIYVFTNDTSKDLAIVRVQGGYKTPLQKILKGTETIEGFISGQATLTVTSPNGKPQIHSFDSNADVIKEVVVAVGQTMQWAASGRAELEFYEVCEPPYEDGRFENLPE
jgi:hypothetical protein